MKALLEVIDGGFGNSIQDEGRFGYRHMGITVSGCLDRQLARCANALVGNTAEGSNQACIEIRAVGPKLAVKSGRVRVAIAGELGATLRQHTGTVQGIPSWTSITLTADDVLEVGTVKGGVAYLAICGGIDSPLQLGSRSTYQRALIGGIDGRLLGTGNRLPCKSLEKRDPREYQAPAWRHDEGPIRVMLGPQDSHFTPEALTALLDTEYSVTPQMDRMGMRLEGAPLAQIRPEAADIVSDGVTPGVMQVPGNGQPIILLADCQTVGGYPKIATVISADLPRLAQLRPGQKLRFAAVDAHAARAALDVRDRKWDAWVAAIRYGLPGVDVLGNDAEVVWNPL